MRGGSGTDPARIRVGIIGATPERGWAVRAHIPALRALPEFTLTAVGTTRQESADAAAAAFGAAHAFTDAGELSRHPEVDLVVVTVKVPAHLELVRSAIDAGKHVLCEWPLARTTAEAESLAKAADAAGVHDAIGLQARYAPAVLQAGALIANDYVGRVLSVTVHATRGKGADEAVPGWSEYTYQRENGAGLLEVAGGHTLDLVEHLLGEFTELSADLALRRPEHHVAETGRAIEVTSPDHLLLHGRLAGGAAASVHLHDGKPTEAGTRIEIAGTLGDLLLVSAGTKAAMGVQIGTLELYGVRHGREPDWLKLPIPLEVPDGDAEPGNVARLYADLAGDIHSGSRRAPGFATGVRLHRLLDTVRLSAETGQRQSRQL